MTKVAYTQPKPFGDLAGAKDIKAKSENKTIAETKAMAEIRAKATPQLKVADTPPAAKPAASKIRPTPAAKIYAVASDDPAAHGWKKGPQAAGRAPAPSQAPDARRGDPRRAQRKHEAVSSA